jgi:hypothetical protein
MKSGSHLSDCNLNLISSLILLTSNAYYPTQYLSSRKGKIKLPNKSPTAIINEVSVSISAEGKQQGIRLETEL